MQKYEHKPWQLLAHLPDAFIYQKLITDDLGKPTDALLVFANAAFEELTGVRAEKMIGKRLTDVFTGETTPFVDWCMAEVESAAAGKPTVYIRHLERSGRWYRIQAYSDQAGHVAVLFQDQSQDLGQSMSDAEKFKNYVDNAPYGIFIHNEEGEYLEVNKRACEMTGYSKEELLGMNLLQLIPEEQHQWVLARETELLKGGKLAIQTSYKRKDNTKREWYVSTIKLSEREYLGFVQDITEQKQAEENLQLLLKEHETIFNGTQDAMFLVEIDEHGLFRFIRNNQTHQRLTGLSCEAIAAKTPQELLGNTVGDQVAANYQKCVEQGKPIHYEETLAFPEGQRIWQTTLTPVLHRNRIYYLVGSSQDITERKKADERIRFLSFNDSLTGLYNRAYLNEEMKRLDTSRSLPISVIMVDMNGLKLINDTYGHFLGDEVIKECAEVLKRSCRKEDIIARWGGDEFLVFLPKTNSRKAGTICNRIISNAKDAFVEQIPISMAVGMAVKDSEETPFSDVLKQAEDSMYKHKLTESKSARNAILGALLKALKEKSYETEQHVQRMQITALGIGKRVGLPDSELQRLHLLISLHDIGKINIAEGILKKKEPLTKHEWKTIQEHPEIGYRIALATEDFAHVADDILSHHERWDGLGYPRGLKEKEIPLLARITAIADAYEVMSNGRPYKEPLPRDRVIKEFEEHAGSQFDPELVEHFLAILEDQ